MSVNPIDRTDEKLIHLVNDLGDPTVETQEIAEEVDLGFQRTKDRLETLENQGWIDGQTVEGKQAWQVASKSGLLVRTDSGLSAVNQDDPDIIDAEPGQDEGEEGSG